MSELLQNLCMALNSVNASDNQTRSNAENFIKQVS